MITDRLNFVWQGHRFSALCYTLSGWMLASMMVIARVSITLKVISLLTSLALIVVAGEWQKNFKAIFTNKVVIAALMLYGGFLIGTVYSIASHQEQWHMLRIHLSLLYIAILIALFRQVKWRIIIINAFIFGCAVVVVLGLINYLTIINLSQLFTLPKLGTLPEYPFGTFSFSLSFAGYLTAHMAWYAEHRLQKAFYIMLLMLFTFFIFFVSHQRTAYVLSVMLAIMFMYQHFNVKQMIVASGLVCLILLTAFTLSATFHDRSLEVAQNIKDYYQGNPISSTGLRMLFIKNSFLLWQHHPILGYGTGSFIDAYLSLNSYNAFGNVSTIQQPLDQPHNQYAFILVQLGLFGLILFLNLMITQLMAARKLPLFYKHIAHAFTVSFMIACIDGTILFYSVEAGYFAVFTALIFGCDENGLPN